MEVDVPGLVSAPGGAAVSTALRLAQSNHTVAVSYATEAGHFQRAGVPTVVCGPGSIDQAHKPDEYVSLIQIQACLNFLQNLTGELAA
jgi:acetylornithine deacetylase